jgi:hypothetical protein
MQNQGIDKLSSAVSQYQHWFILASREIEQLRADLQELEKGLNCSDATLLLRTEVTNLKNKVRSPFHQYEMWSPTCAFTPDFSVIYFNIILQYCTFKLATEVRVLCFSRFVNLSPDMIFTCKKVMILLECGELSDVLMFVGFTGHCKINIVHCKSERGGGGVVWPNIRREDCFQKLWV